MLYYKYFPYSQVTCRLRGGTFGVFTNLFFYCNT